MGRLVGYARKSSLTTQIKYIFGMAKTLVKACVTYGEAAAIPTPHTPSQPLLPPLAPTGGLKRLCVNILWLERLQNRKIGLGGQGI